MPHSHVVTTMLRSTPCGRGGLLFGSSPLAMRSVQSPRYLNGAPPKAAGLVGHLLAGLAGLNAPHPGLFAGLELAELRRDGARRFLADLVAANAADVLHLLEPVGLLISGMRGLPPNSLSGGIFNIEYQ